MRYGLLYAPEGSFRGWWCQQYQNSLIDDEPSYAKCVSCSEDIPATEEVYLYANKYCCEDCIINEMREEDKTRDEAIEAFKQFALRYR